MNRWRAPGCFECPAASQVPWRVAFKPITPCAGLVRVLLRFESLPVKIVDFDLYVCKIRAQQELLIPHFISS
jgi:hypothetical protein